MKKLLLTMLLLSSSLIYAVPIKLPDAQILESRFIEKGLKNFIASTDIISKLAGTEREPAGVILYDTIGIVLKKFQESLQNQPILEMPQLSKYDIYEIILRDYPEVLEKVKIIIADSYSFLVELPDAETLEDRFKQDGFESLIDNTDIVKQLAGKQLELFDVFKIVLGMLASYGLNVNNRGASIWIKMRKYNIYALILRDFPEGLEQIRKIDANQK